MPGECITLNPIGCLELVECTEKATQIRTTIGEDERFQQVIWAAGWLAIFKEVS
jgi:hypothetical protein